MAELPDIARGDALNIIDPSPLGPLFDAIQERMTALNPDLRFQFGAWSVNSGTAYADWNYWKPVPPNTRWSNGVIFQDLIGTMQRWIKSYCTQFVKSHNNDGTPRAAGYFAGADALEFWSWTDLKTAAKMNAGGWTCYTDETSGPVYRDDMVHRGDYVQAAISFAEIKACLKLLVWTPWYGSSLYNPAPGVYYWGAGFDAPWDDKGEANIRFAGSDGISLTVDVVQPGQWVHCDPNDPNSPMEWIPPVLHTYLTPGVDPNPWAWPATAADADVHYPGAAPTRGGHADWTNSPTIYNYGQWRFDYFTGGQDLGYVACNHYNAGIGATFAYARMNHLPTIAAKAIDLYGYAVKPIANGGTTFFSAWGETQSGGAALVENKLNYLGTVNAAKETDTAWSAKIGSLNPTTAWQGDPQVIGFWMEGYRYDHTAPVVRWNVVGGFKYQ